MRKRRWCELLGGVFVVIMTSVGCTGSGDDAVEWDEARSDVQSLVPELQEAFALDDEVSWSGPVNASLAVDDAGDCRWRPGEWSASLALPEGDPSWGARRESVNQVLAQHDLAPVGEPDYTGGSAYGFETEGPAGGTVRIDSWKGTTTIYLHGLAVEVDGECDDARLP